MDGGWAEGLNCGRDRARRWRCLHRTAHLVRICSSRSGCPEVSTLIDYQGSAREAREQARRYYRVAWRLEHREMPRCEANASRFDQFAAAAARGRYGDGDQLPASGSAGQWRNLATGQRALAAEARALAARHRQTARERNALARWYEARQRELSAAASQLSGA